MWGPLEKLTTDVSGAVAPMVALSLLGLIGAGGIAFDYARLATLDTELQQAADQAALAAATQLDRAEGAQTRATAAISDGDEANRLASNLTKFANDGDGLAVEIESVTFCDEFDDSVEDTVAACDEAEDDSDSRFVVVTTTARTANYALTPIVAFFQSTVSATAVAGIESSICNVAPLLVCTGSDDFPTDADIGKGMIMKVAGGNSWAPGNYGFLDFGNGNPAVINALMGHGLNGCQSTDDNETEPGNKNATDAINTRMDVYGGTGATKNPNVCKVADGTGCPAENTRKDMTIAMTFERRVATSAGKPPPPGCGAVEGGTVNGVGKTSYDTTDFVQNVNAKQFGRDTCHYSAQGCAGGNFGDAAWDRAAYIAANHPGQTAASIAAAIGGSATASTLTRYQVYQWEIANKASGKLDPVQVSPTTEDTPKVQGSNTTYTFHKQCAFNKPRLASAAYPAQKDRRVLPVVAANCDNLKGKGSAFEDYVILRVFDVFLTEPSLQRSPAQARAGGAVGTDDKEIYAEIMGPAETFEGGSGFQYYSRNKPYLVR